MGGRARALWSLAAVGAIGVVTAVCLVAVWRSPHRSDLATYGAFAVALIALAAGWIAWALRAGSRQASGIVPGKELGRLSDLLAGAVGQEWTRAAGEQKLLEPEPIPM